MVNVRLSLPPHADQFSVITTNQPSNQQEYFLEVGRPDDVKRRIGYHEDFLFNKIYPPRSYDWLTYLHGIRNNDGMALEPGVGSVHLEARDLGLLIKIKTIINEILVGLKYREIKEITIEQGEKVQQGGNVIGGAVLGGILLGPLGAVIGGLSRAGSKTVGTNLLVIKYKLEDKNEGVLIFTQNGGKQGMHDFLKNNLSEYYKIQ